MSYGVARHAISGVLLAADNYSQLVGAVFDQPHHLGESRVIKRIKLRLHNNIYHLSMENIGLKSLS